MTEEKEIRVSGTKEWASHNVNCVNGCKHGCKYCYARTDAVVRFKRIAAEDWVEMKPRPHDVKKKRKLLEGTVMFPTTHDICPSVLPECLEVLKNLLAAGNQLLIVSKPHLECIKVLCQELAAYKEKILFRFTIGAMDDAILGYWEPGAPKFAERLASLKWAYEDGYSTSVSCEPMLDGANVIDLFCALEPFVTDSIWIGKMNRIDGRVAVETEQDKLMVATVKDGQTDEKIMAIVEALKIEPKVRWKESIKEVAGFELASEIGLDI